MSRARQIGMCLIAAVIGAAGVLLPSSAAATPRIVLSVSDTAVVAGDTFYLSVSLSNLLDTVAAFQFQLRIDRPDLVWFDTTAAPDAAGALTADFELLAANDTTHTASQLLVSGIADMPFDHTITPGIAPQTGGLLVRLPLIVNPAPDTSTGRTAAVEVVNPLAFVNPEAGSIGIITDTIVDTIYWQCSQWQGDSCAKWIQVNGSSVPYDSIEFDSSLYGYLDTTQVVAENGAVTVNPPATALPCDLSNDGNYAVTDLTCLVSYLFGTYDPIGCPNLQCDCDNSGNPPTAPNVGDLTCLVAFLFKGGHPPLGP